MTDAFKNAVIQYLKPFEGNFNYETMLSGHLDICRFHSWANEVSQYKEVTGSVVLSSGCGSAGDLFAFMEAGASKAYGIEVSDGLADLARKRFLGTRFEDFVQIDVYDGSVLPYNNDSFDIILSMHVIEHTQNPPLYLTELFRVLRPGGVIFLDVPNRYYKMEQHTLLPYIHFLPMKPRDAFTGVLLSRPFSYLLSGQTKYKLETLVSFHFPSASQLVRIYSTYQATYSLKLEDAFYHSYAGERVPYKAYFGKYLLGRARKMTTFRMVIRELRNVLFDAEDSKSHEPAKNPHPL